MNKENILGVDVCVTDYNSLKDLLLQDVIDNRKAFLVAINPEKILKARKDKELTELLNNASYQIPDGIGVVYASKLRGGNIRSRITGIDSMDIICKLSAENSFKVFLYGAKPDVVAAAAKKLEETYPGINIAGYMDGYQKDNEKVIEAINKSEAQVLFVAMGSPKQEYWIKDNMHKVCPLLFQGVGGSFDVVSGNIKRAPKWMQNAGLEWFYRLIKEPSRIGRQAKLLSFLYLAISDRSL